MPPETTTVHQSSQACPKMDHRGPIELLVRQGRRTLKVGTNLQCVDRFSYETYDAVGNAVFTGVEALLALWEDSEPVDTEQTTLF